jgi:phosphoribosylaminoimidazole-succinocarboxamide synthase
VRDIYAVDGDKMLILVSDRLSAFDVVLADPIPDKGRVLNDMANFWFAKLAHVVPNHLTGIDPETVVRSDDEKAQVRGRSIVVKKLKALPVEAVVRGYLIGSGWKDYQKTGAVCGIVLPKGLQQAQKLPEPIFTPATKAESGHDENISFERMCEIVGQPLAEKIRETSIRLYREAADFAATRGILIADTKFEFGTDEKGNLVLIDEVLTADSFALLAGGRVQDRHLAAFVRQAVCARLPRDARLGQDAAGAEASRRGDRQDLGQVPRGARAPDGKGTLMSALVGIVMGSTSDWETMQAAAKMLDEFGVPYEAKAMSAHRSPKAVSEWASGARRLVG